MFLKEQVYICTIAETGSISRAAERLYISQPALSAYLRNVEDTLGIPLFVRSGKRCTPTLIGEKYIKNARQMIALQDDFNLDLAHTVKGVLGRIRIGTQTRRSPILLSPILRFFWENYPGIEVNFEESNAKGLLAMLDERKVDIIIFTATERLPELSYLDIYPEELLLATPLDHPARKYAKEVLGKQYKSIELKYFADDMFFIPHHSQSLRNTCESLFANSNFTPKRIFEVRNIEAIMTLVADGLGVGFNRASYSKHMNQNRVLSKISYYNVPYDSASADFVIAFQKKTQHSEQFISMISNLRDMLKILP